MTSLTGLRNILRLCFPNSYELGLWIVFPAITSWRLWICLPNSYGLGLWICFPSSYELGLWVALAAGNGPDHQERFLAADHGFRQRLIRRIERQVFFAREETQEGAPL